MVVELLLLISGFLRLQPVWTCLPSSAGCPIALEIPSGLLEFKYRKNLCQEEQVSMCKTALSLCSWAQQIHEKTLPCWKGPPQLVQWAMTPMSLHSLPAFPCLCFQLSLHCVNSSLGSFRPSISFSFHFYAPVYTTKTPTPA